MTKSTASRLYWLTNRYNFIAALANGFIGPASTMVKYYQDYLVAAPGRVPLFQGPLPQELLAPVTVEDQLTAFPVLVELNLESLACTSAPALTRLGIPLDAASPADDLLCIAPRTMIPVDALIAVHFADESVQNEVTIREYENLDLSALPTRVSPHLFAGTGGVSATALLHWLNSLPAEPHPQPSDFRREDLVRGALSMIRAASATSSDPSGNLARMAYASDVSGLDTTSLAQYQWLAQSLRPQTDPAPGKYDDIESIVFMAAVDVFHRTDRFAVWRPVEVLNAIEEQVNYIARADDAALLNSYFRHIRAILRMEEDFSGFRPDGLTVPKALLLVLSRPDPRRLLAWPREEPTITEPVLVTAAAFSGLLTGYALLPLELRDRRFDAELVHASARYIFRSVPNAWLHPEDPDADANASVDATHDQPTADDAAVQAWLAADLALSPWREATINLCSDMGWHDCVSTQVIAPDDFPFTISQRVDRRTSRKKVMVIEIPGMARVEHHVKTDAVRSRLQESNTDLKLMSALRKYLVS